MLSPTKHVHFRDHVFVVDENVYEPAEDSIFLAENLDVTKGEAVLDMGTGCGILAVLAAEKADSVLAVDVNPYALRCARENAVLHDTRSKMSFLQGDLFTPLTDKARFDVILFNAPYLPSAEDEGDSWLERAWAGGVSGREIIDRFIQQLPAHLTPSGRAFLLQSNIAGLDETMSRFSLCGLSARVVAERVLPFFETLFLLEARIR